LALRLHLMVWLQTEQTNTTEKLKYLTYYNSSSSLNSEIKKEPSGSFFFGRINTIVRITLQTHTHRRTVCQTHQKAVSK
jgi:hypothetical protein